MYSMFKMFIRILSYSYIRINSPPSYELTKNIWLVVMSSMRLCKQGKFSKYNRYCCNACACPWGWKDFCGKAATWGSSRITFELEDSASENLRNWAERGIWAAFQINCSLHNIFFKLYSDVSGKQCTTHLLQMFEVYMNLLHVYFKMNIHVT